MFTSVIVAALGATCAFAAPSPLVRRWGSTKVNDTQILQFALTLELLESTFYREALEKFNATDFTNAGFDPAIRERFLQIQEHELTHVELLQGILGADAPQACNYSFPITDVPSFVNIAFALESTGESAYLGAAAFVTDKNVLTTAGSILAVEGRQASWIGSAALNETPWNGPFDTPLNMNGVVSLASGFITSCPASNPPLPVIPLNVLTISPANATIGQTVTVQVSGLDDFLPANIPITTTNFQPAPAPLLPGKFVAYFHGGTNVTYSEIAADSTTVIPGGLAGFVYASVVSSNLTAPANNDTLSGVVMLNIPVPLEADSSSD